VTRVNELVKIEAHRVELSRSMDRKTAFLEGVRSQKSAYHGDTKLLREGLYIFNRCTPEEREWLKAGAVSEADVRKMLNKDKPENKKKGNYFLLCRFNYYE
jgi:hypothetical protein